MPEAALGLHLFLLQTYFKEDDPLQARILIIAITVIVVFALVSFIIRRLGGKTVVSKKSGYMTPTRFSYFAFRRAAKPYGLSREQLKLLESVFRNDSVSDPARVIKDPALLDRHFKQAFRDIERDSRGSERTQQSIARLFALRNHIEAAIVEDDTIKTKPVENSQVIIKYGKDAYNVRVLISQGETIVTEIPKNVLGTPLRASNGSNITLTYLSRSGSNYSLVCEVEGVEKTQYGPGFQVTALGDPVPLAKRQSRRRQVDIRCEFYFVQLVKSARRGKKASKLVVTPKRFTGDIKDISAGGCSIRTVVPVYASTRLKINCTLDRREQISVLGQVIRSNRSSAGTVIHVKFVKVPMRAFNSINTLVFGFDEDTENRRRRIHT